jgi:hypothetical protein
VENVIILVKLVRTQQRYLASTVVQIGLGIKMRNVFAKHQTILKIINLIVDNAIFRVWDVVAKPICLVVNAKATGQYK